MATNYVQKGDVINLPVTADKVSGDFDMVGTLPVVLLSDRDSDGNADCCIVGVFDLSVKGANDSGNVAVAAGDKIYLDSTELNKDATNGVEFGTALEAVVSGATATINVRLKGC